MADIEFGCPNCKQSLSIDETGRGMTIQCPSCQMNVTVPAARPAPPAQVIPEAQVLPQKPKLWNPTAAVNWSLMFTPAFGAWLHARNWHELGDPAKAKTNMKWFWVGLITYLIYELLEDIAFVVPSTVLAIMAGVVLLACLVVLGGWYSSIGRSQLKYVEGTLQKRYEKRSWWKPLGIGVACWAAILVQRIVVRVVLQMLFGSNL